MNSNMVEPEKFGHPRLVYHFTIPLRSFLGKLPHLELLVTLTQTARTEASRFLSPLHLLWGPSTPT